MDNLSTENVEDVVEKDGRMTGKEFLQKCQLLEDVETSMYHNKKENADSKIKHRYSKDELLKLRTHPLSTKLPSLQENLKFLLGTSKPKEREEIDLKKNMVKKHGLTRNLEGAVNEKFELKKNDNSRNGEKSSINRNEGVDELRKAVGPKERIRKEQDICLSPQRKSFTTGCYVANVKNENAANNSSSTSSKANNENMGRENRESRDNREIREIRDSRDSRDNRDNRDNKNFREGSRRIGSGRIISRDPRFEIRGYPESDYSSRSSYYAGKEKIPTVVYERKFPPNFDKEKDNKIWDRQRSYNYYDKRRSHDHDVEEEEPEWMKDGPVSLDDVIELKGFDETEEKSFRFNRNSRINTRVFHKSLTNNPNNRSPTAANTKSRTDKRNSDSDNSSVASDSLASKTDENNSSNISKNDELDKQKTTEKPQKEEISDVKNVENSIQFNLDEILKLDPLPDISENVDNESAGSKFTRWFKREEPPSSNVNGEQNLTMARNGLFPSLSNLPGESGRTQNVSGPNIHTSNNHSSGSNLLELLRGSQENNANAKVDMRALEATGKLHSVEEIEAKLRGTENNVSSNPNSPNDKKKKEEETEAFKKLLSQAFHFDKTSNDGNSSDMGFSQQKFERNDNTDGKIDLASVMCNGENQANTLSNIQPQMSRLPPQMNSMQQSAEKFKFLQMQQNKQQQEILSKVLMSPSSAAFSVPPPSGIRPSNGAPNNGPFPHIAPEIQIMMNSVQPTRELMQRPETVNILRALKGGELSQYQLIEQLKKLTPYQAKFRESLLCVLKLIQMQYYNSTSVLGSPTGIPYNVVPPPLSAAQPYSENILQQMMLNSQFRVNGLHNGMPNIVYQRDFPSSNQNMYQNNPIKKHLVEQSPNIGQNVQRMNSPTSTLSAPVSGNNVANTTSSIISSPDDVNNAVILNKTASTTQPLSFTPTSVLRKLSAEKENLDTFSKEAKESKGEKNTRVPYTANANNSSNTFTNHGTVDHFNGLGTCIPPPAISGQYFVGNTIRPASISTQVPMCGNPPPSVLSRLPVPSNSLAAPRDANISMVGFGNQSFLPRNAPMNGTLSSAEEQMARWFSSDVANQSRYVMAQSMGGQGAPLQNMMSVEEIERVQQSVHN